MHKDNSRTHSPQQNKNGVLTAATYFQILCSPKVAETLTRNGYSFKLIQEKNFSFVVAVPTKA